MPTVTEVLKRKDLKLESGIYIIHGSEELLHKNFINFLKKHYKTVNIYYGDSIDLDTFVQILGEKSLFSSKGNVNVLLNGESFFKKLRKKQKELLVKFLGRRIDNIVIISILADLKKSELSKEPFKTLFSVAKEVFTAKPLNRTQVANLIKKKFKTLGIQYEEGVVEYLLESFSDLVQLKLELEKLITYLGDKKKLTLSEVKELVEGNPAYTVFDFQKVFFEKDLAGSLKIFKSLLEGLTSYERTSLVLQLEGLILTTLNRLLVATERTRKGEDLKNFSKKLGLYYPFQVSQFKRWLQLWSERELFSALRQLYQLDQNIKLKFQPPVETFEKFLFKVLS